LHAQLIADGFAIAFAALLTVWRRGGAVALAAFREGVRQPLFWVFAGGTALLLSLSLFVPYFTFGEDYKFMKQIGFDTVMLAAVAFGVIAAGTSISEEIEGRTAITLMSKPVSRRQFLLGKFVGIFLAAVLLTLLGGWVLQWTLYFKPMFDPMVDVIDPLQAQFEPWLTGVAQVVTPAGEAFHFVRGVVLWASEGLSLLAGLVIAACQVMVLLAVAAALATRLSMVVNLVACLVAFFLGHLAPVLVQVASNWQARFAAENYGQSSAAIDLVQFMARLFDTVLPALQYFNLGPAIVRDQPLPVVEYGWYVASVVLYSMLYTAIALLLGLILFEDRDLA
jgi:ABC-type transport system involved in multi-copper enzyme maturation permease subunit